MEAVERCLLLLQSLLRLLRVAMVRRHTKIVLQWQVGVLPRLVLLQFNLLMALQQSLVCEPCLKRLLQLPRCQAALHCSWRVIGDSSNTTKCGARSNCKARACANNCCSCATVRHWLAAAGAAS